MMTYFSLQEIQIILPRYLSAFFIGINLSISGFLIQILTKNNLADTKLMGVSSGGLVAVAILTVLNIPFQNYIYYPIVFIGCILSACAIFIISLRAQANPIYILLSGIGISSLLYSIAISIFILNNEDLLSVYAWSAGSLTNANWDGVYFLLAFSIFGSIITYIISPSLKIYELGQQTALSLGLKYKSYSFLLIILITCLVSSTVCIGGSIGFIGILVPNIGRMIFSTNYKKIIIFSALFGGIILVMAQKVCQLFSSYQDIPVGCMTALLGSVFLIFRNFKW